MSSRASRLTSSRARPSPKRTSRLAHPVAESVASELDASRRGRPPRPRASGPCASPPGPRPEPGQRRRPGSSSGRVAVALEQRVQRRGLRVDVLAQPPGDQPARSSAAGSRRRAATSADGIGVGDRDQAVQIRSGRLWSAASSVRGQQRRGQLGRRSTGSRWSVEASTRRTRPEGSSRASPTSSAEQVRRAPTSGADPPAEDRVERQGVGQQADRPGADGLVLVSAERVRRSALVGRADGVERPERPEPDGPGRAPRSAIAPSRVRLRLVERLAARPRGRPGRGGPGGRTTRSGAGAGPPGPGRRAGRGRPTLVSDCGCRR